MAERTSIAPFSGKDLSFGWRKMVGLVTLAPIRIVIFTPLLLLAWLSSRIG